MKQSTDAVKWDFSYWMDLAMNDPEEFESKRAETISKVIQNASEESRIRLERLQWRIDRTRERSSSPMAATLEISRMMWDSFYNLRDRYQELFSEAPMTRRHASPSQSAKVIEFRRFAEVSA